MLHDWGMNHLSDFSLNPVEDKSFHFLVSLILRFGFIKFQLNEIKIYRGCFKTIDSNMSAHFLLNFCM